MAASGRDNILLAASRLNVNNDPRRTGSPGDDERLSSFWDGWNCRDVLCGDFDLGARCLVRGAGGVRDRLKATVYRPGNGSSIIHNFAHARDLTGMSVSIGQVE